MRAADGKLLYFLSNISDYVLNWNSRSATRFETKPIQVIKLESKLKYFNSFKSKFLLHGRFSTKTEVFFLFVFFFLIFNPPLSYSLNSPLHHRAHMHIDNHQRTHRAYAYRWKVFFFNLDLYHKKDWIQSFRSDTNRTETSLESPVRFQTKYTIKLKICHRMRPMKNFLLLGWFLFVCF